MRATLDRNGLAATQTRMIEMHRPAQIALVITHAIVRVNVKFDCTDIVVQLRKICLKCDNPADVMQRVGETDVRRVQIGQTVQVGFVECAEIIGEFL